MIRAGERIVARLALVLAVSLALSCGRARIAVDRLFRAAPPPANLALQDGDIVFQRSRSVQSAAIAAATRSNWTHTGIILLEGGHPLVLEAVQPTKLTPFAAWVARGVRGRVVVKRLEGASRIFTPEVRAKMHALGHSWLGRGYDLQFQWSDDRLYCSELVYKLLDRAAGVRIGKLEKAGDMALASPEVQEKLRERFGGAKGVFDPNEPVISPQSIFDDPRLITVYSN